jgi:hypothetical protein
VDAPLSRLEALLSNDPSGRVRQESFSWRLSLVVAGHAASAATPPSCGTFAGQA